MKRTLLVVAVLSAGCSNGGSKTKPSAPPAGVEIRCPSGTETVVEGTAMWCEKPTRIKHGPIVRWSKEGVVTQRGTFSDGQMHGAFSSFTENGNRAHTSNYEHGREHGTFTWWHADGTKSSESHYVQGRYHGTHTNYDKAGNPIEMNEYVYGNRVRAVTYKEGKVTSDQNFPIEIPKGKAATRTHSAIPVEWQACTAHHDCVYVAMRCCACGPSDWVAVNHKHSKRAEAKLKPLRSCKNTRCPQQKCTKVGARCDDGQCVTAN